MPRFCFGNNRGVILPTSAGAMDRTTYDDSGGILTIGIVGAIWSSSAARVASILPRRIMDDLEKEEVEG